MQGRTLSEEGSGLFYHGDDVVFVNCLHTLGRAAKRLKESDLVCDSSQESFTTQGFYIFRVTSFLSISVYNNFKTM